MEIQIIFKLDGDAWCAHYPWFINLQESAVGFGDTPQEAFQNLLNEHNEFEGA